VTNFANLRPNETVFTVDRRAGSIRFAPSAEISDDRGELRQGRSRSAPSRRRVGRSGSATAPRRAAGNVAAGSITTLRDQIPGQRDEWRARDRRPRRGIVRQRAGPRPTDFHRLERAVTARDVETLARRSSGVARAKAFTKSEFWKYAKPGIVEVRLVPTLGSDVSTLRPTMAELRPETTDELDKVLHALDAVRTLGSSLEVGGRASRT